jgi:hypothetical protein
MREIALYGLTKEWVIANAIWVSHRLYDMSTSNRKHNNFTLSAEQGTLSMNLFVGNCTDKDYDRIIEFFESK